MKTLKDLFELALNEERLNSNKMQKNYISIDMQYKNVTFVIDYGTGKIEKEYILNMFSVDDEALIQQAYWTCFNNSRTKSEK